MDGMEWYVWEAPDEVDFWYHQGCIYICICKRSIKHRLLDQSRIPGVGQSTGISLCIVP